MLLSTAFTFLLIILSASREVHGSRCLTNRHTKLFVFGDSYVDAGNTNKLLSASWTPPYGITFPGKPSGRWSNGRVWSDYVAKHFGLRSPVPYEQRNMRKKKLKYGMNFAYGGTGVFNTLVPYPNMTVQIDYFQKMINDGVYRREDLSTSVALVAVSGNDLGLFNEMNGRNVSAQKWHRFQDKIVHQTMVNIRRIEALGVRSIAVDSLQPLGCLPVETSADSFTTCDEFANQICEYQNHVLLKEMKSLAKKTPETKYYYLDFYKAWLSVFKKNGKQARQNPLQPCCWGTNANFSCGSIDEYGVKQYTLCKNPGSSFFWDSTHPSQKGWKQVYLKIKSTFHPLGSSRER